jgi:predicted HTH domain antitoxin
MEVSLQISDDIAIHLAASGGDLSRRALESLAIEELRAGRISERQLREMLGLARIELDGFLKSHGVYHDYTMDDLEHEIEGLKRLGI